MSNQALAQSPGDQVALSISEPYEFVGYIHNPYFFAEVLYKFSDLWVVGIDRPIECRGGKTARLLLSPRNKGTKLSDITTRSDVSANMLPLLGGLNRDEYLKSVESDVLRSETTLAAAWCAHGGLYSVSKAPARCSADGLNYYSTSADYHTCFNGIESALNIRLLQRDDGPASNGIAFESILNLPGLGISLSGNWEYVRGIYWILEQSELLPTIRVREADGRVNDRPTIRGGVEFRTSGLYANKTMIAGSLSYNTDNTSVQKIYNILVDRIRNVFIPVQGCWLGTEAYKMYQAGMRFTTSVKSNDPYDLKPFAN